MNENNSSAGGVSFKIGTTNNKGTENNILPVEELSEDNNSNTMDNNNTEEIKENLDLPYTHENSVSIALVKSSSLYRRANDKVLPKRKDYIGSSVHASRTLSSNKEEIEKYFPGITGVAPNNPDFITRVKNYLNNIKIGVDELGKTFNTSFIYKKKSDYYRLKAEEDAIEADYLKVNRQDITKLKAALKEKISRINALESIRHLYGQPVEVEEYLMYRHCLLYNDIAKDVAIINSDPNIRFYFKDDQKEADKLRKFRGEVIKAKTNYVSALSDDVLFESIYTQYLVLNNQPVIAGLAESSIDKEVKLDKFSTEEPVKFNAMFSNKDVKIIGNIELLIARGELQRSDFNQNISTTDGTFIGSNMKEAVIWFKHPDNVSTVNSYINKLKNI